MKKNGNTLILQQQQQITSVHIKQYWLVQNHKNKQNLVKVAISQNQHYGSLTNQQNSPEEYHHHHHHHHQQSVKVKVYTHRQ